MHCKHKQTVNNTSKTNGQRRQQVQVQVEVEVDKKSSVSRLISQARRDWRNGQDDTYTSGPARPGPSGPKKRERTYVSHALPPFVCLYCYYFFSFLFYLYETSATIPNPNPSPNCRLTKIMRIQFARHKEK